MRKKPREQQTRWEKNTGIFGKAKRCVLRLLTLGIHVLVSNILNQLLTAAETVHT